MSITIAGPSAATSPLNQISERIGPVLKDTAKPVTTGKTAQQGSVMVPLIATTPVSAAARLLDEIAGKLARLQGGKVPTPVAAKVISAPVVTSAKPATPVAAIAVKAVVTPPVKDVPKAAVAVSLPEPIYAATITAPPPTARDIPQITAAAVTEPLPRPGPVPDIVVEARAPQPEPRQPRDDTPPPPAAIVAISIAAPPPPAAREEQAAKTPDPTPEAAQAPAAPSEAQTASPAPAQPNTVKIKKVAKPQARVEGAPVPKGSSGVAERGAGVSMRDLYLQHVGNSAKRDSVLTTIASDGRFASGSGTGGGRSDLLVKAAFDMVARAQQRVRTSYVKQG